MYLSYFMLVPKSVINNVTLYKIKSRKTQILWNLRFRIVVPTAPSGQTDQKTQRFVRFLFSVYYVPQQDKKMIDFAL